MCTRPRQEIKCKYKRVMTCRKEEDVFRSGGKYNFWLGISARRLSWKVNTFTTVSALTRRQEKEVQRRGRFLLFALAVVYQHRLSKFITARGPLVYLSKQRTQEINVVVPLSTYHRETEL